MFGRPVARPEYGALGNRVAAQYRSMPQEKFVFERSALRDALRILAEAAGVPYIGLPEHSPKGQQLVTFKMTASPFAAMESLARQNDVQLSYEDGVWFMRVRDSNLERFRAAEKDNELVGILYQLKYDPVDVVDFQASRSGGSGGSGGDSGNNSNNNNDSNDSGGSGSSIGTQIPLQYPQRVFTVKAPKIVNEIRAMLGLPALKYTDGQAEYDLAAGAETSSKPIPPYDGVILDSGGGGQPGAPSPEGGATSPGGPQGPDGGAPGGGGGSSGQFPFHDDKMFPVYVPPQKPQVIYNSDMNLLWVVATRKQHKWVADYLSRVDRPQDLIAIEVKFFETNRNPQTDFGINWEGVFGGDGLQVTGEGSIGANPLGSISGQNGAVTFNAPYSAVLSVQQATLAIQAFTRDREGSLVQYPRVLTINNREVAITSAENTPINTGTAAVGGNATATQNIGSIQYLPTGTQINILPKAIGKDQIALTVAITISSIIDQVPLNLGTGVNEYPVTAQRVYNASLQVDSGYTLAVGGLEKSTDLRSTGGIPVLKDIPGVGYLFKNKSRDRSRSNLIIFITPYVISDPSRTPGISEKPGTTIPVRPGVPPPAPTFSPDGNLIGGDAAVPAALAWLEYQLKYFRQINAEARDDAKTNNELRAVIQRARALSEFLQSQVLESAGYAPAVLVDNSARADALLVELNKVLGAAQLDQFQLNEGFP